MNRTALILAATLVTATSQLSHAQTAAWVEVDNKTMIAPFNADADRLEDMDVHDAAGKKIGEVEDVIGKDGTAAQALVVDFDDDAGYGDRDDVIVSLDQFSLDGVKVLLKADAAAVAAFEVYND